ncbi:hypothetical protein Ancab_032178 [Ancistrocladus abbreviatus]
MSNSQIEGICPTPAHSYASSVLNRTRVKRFHCYTISVKTVDLRGKREIFAGEKGVKYDDLISRDGDQSSIFLAFNQPLPESKSILRRCIQRSNSNEHSDPWWIRRQQTFYQSFHRILLSMFDFQSSSLTGDRLVIVSELSQLDQGRRDPIRSDLLVVTMKRRRKKDVALLPMCS